MRRLHISPPTAFERPTCYDIIEMLSSLDKGIRPRHCSNEGQDSGDAAVAAAAATSIAMLHRRRSRFVCNRGRSDCPAVSAQSHTYGYNACTYVRTNGRTDGRTDTATASTYVRHVLIQQQLVYFYFSWLDFLVISPWLRHLKRLFQILGHAGNNRTHFGSKLTDLIQDYFSGAEVKTSMSDGL